MGTGVVMGGVMGYGVTFYPFMAFLTEMTALLEQIDSSEGPSLQTVWDLSYTLLRYVIFVAGGGFVGSALMVLAEPLVKTIVDAATHALRQASSDTQQGQKDLPPWVRTTGKKEELTRLGDVCVERVYRLTKSQLVSGSEPAALLGGKTVNFPLLFST